MARSIDNDVTGDSLVGFAAQVLQPKDTTVSFKCFPIDGFSCLCDRKDLAGATLYEPVLKTLFQPSQGGTDRGLCNIQALGRSRNRPFLYDDHVGSQQVPVQLFGEAIRLHV